MPGSSLFPEYRQVEAFGPDEDYVQCDGEVEEEVAYVTLDLGAVEPALVPSTSSYRLIGLDTPTPFLQLSGTIFRGQHQALLGTELLFAEGKDDHHDRSRKSLVHIGTTEHRIRFKEVELREKGTGAVSDGVHLSATSKKRMPRTMNEMMGNVPEGESTRARGASKRKVKGKGKSKEKANDQPDDADAQPPDDARARATSGKSKSKKKDKGKARALEPPPANVPSDAPADDGPQSMDVDDG